MNSWQGPTLVDPSPHRNAGSESSAGPPAGSGPGIAVPVSAAVTAIATVAALQVRNAHRRYGRATTQPGTIDLLVLPPGPTLAEGRPIELLALGDSGMAGVGVTDPSDAVPAQIARQVAAHTGRPVNVISHAEAGARTHDVLIHQLDRVSARPDVVVLLVGANDVIHFTPLRRLSDALTNLLARLRVLGAPVVMSSLPEFGAMRAVPRIPRTVVAARAIAVRRIHRRAAVDFSGAVELVDVRALVGQQFIHDAALMGADRFHPSAAGYSRIADALTPAVVNAVSAGSHPGLSHAGLIESRYRLPPGSAA